MELIFFSFLLILACYLFIARWEHKFIHIFFPSLFIFLSANYLLPVLYAYVTGGTINYSFGYVYVYLCYSIYFTIWMLSYRLNVRLLPVFTRIRLFHVRTELRHDFDLSRFFLLSLLFIFLALLWYYPVITSFKQYLLTPREIYIRTRSGWGIFYYPSILFLKIGFIFGLYASKRFIYKLIVFFLSFPLAYLYGSKAVIVSLFFLFLLYRAYVEDCSIGFLRALVYLVVGAMIILLSFKVTFHRIHDIGVFLKAISSYSDYTRNAIKLLDNYDYYFDNHFYGRLLLEDNFISKIPRKFWKDKPRSFGSFRLARAIYPEKFAKNVGDPSFGLLGRVYADFGVFAIFYLGIAAAIKGFFLRWAVNGLRKTKSIFYFVLALYFADIPLVFVGVGSAFLEHILIAIMVLFLSKINFSAFGLICVGRGK